MDKKYKCVSIPRDTNWSTLLSILLMEMENKLL